MRKSISFLFGAVFILYSYANAQFIVTNTQTVEDLITNILAPGVQISNVTVNGVPANVVNPQVGFFDDMGTGFPIQSGIVMSTGNAVDCAPPGAFASTDLNGGPDPDLLQINNGTAINDAIVVEFDFLATNDTAYFNYSFGSEEYNTFVGFADIFGFFLSGPGITGPFTNNAINIAIVPGTATEVSIATINNGPNNTGPCTNCQYFNWNTASPMAFEGYTSTLQATAAPLQCGEVYHIKMALADNLDGVYDTGVFLEAESFVSTGPNVSLSPINPDGSISTDSVIIEGCTEALLVFTRDDANGDVCYPLAVGGTATPGVDYNVLPDSICMADGEDSVTIAITPLQDGASEGPESITLGTYIISACGDTIPLNGTIWIVDAPSFNAIVSDTTLTCPPGDIDITASTDGGSPPLTYDWGPQGIGGTVSVPPTSGTYSVTITDGCGVTANGTVNVTVNNPPAPTITFNGGATQTVCPGEFITVTPTVTGNTGNVTYAWSYNNSFSPVEHTGTTWDLNPTVDTWVYLQVMDDCNTSIDSMRILMGTLNIGNIAITDITSCLTQSNNGEIQVTMNPAAGNYTFTLTPGGTSNATGFFNNLASGSFNINVVNNVTQCETDSVVFVGSIAGLPPTFSDTNVTHVTCPSEQNGCIEFVDINDDGQFPLSIIWTPSGGGNQIIETDVISSGPTTHQLCTLYGTTWSVDIIDNLGCVTNISIVVNEPQPLDFDLTSNEPLCFGQSNGSIYLNGNGGTLPYDVFIASASDSVNLVSAGGNAAELLATGWYYTSIEDSRGCLNEDSIFLDQPDSMYASIITTDPFCYGEPNGDAIVDQLFHNQGPVQYSWSPSTDSTDWARFLDAGNHTVTIVDSVGCIWAYSFTLNYPDSLYFLSTSSQPSRCRGNGIYPGSGTVSATAAGGTGTPSYSWIGPDGTAPTATWGNRPPGWHYITATDANNCLTTDSIYVDSLNPESQFLVDPLDGTQPVTITIEDQSTNRVTNTWTFSSDVNNDVTLESYIIGYDSLQPAFDTTFVDAGEYTVCLYVANDYDCIDSLCQSVVVFPTPEITNPNVITPNSDNINDEWSPISEGMKEMSCTILNRWGHVVAELLSPSDKWDGRNQKTGKMCSDGVYSYTYNAEAFNGETFSGQGFIHLISK